MANVTMPRNCAPLLVARGHQFRSTTDTEVVVHLYEEYGDRCVEKLRGMFAFAIWDARRRLLLLARDRLGIKPLYYNYSAGSDRLLFASEIKGLLASQAISRKIDPSGIRAFLQLGHIPPPWTAIQGVKPLEPGYVGIWQGGNFRTNPYWKLPTVNERPSAGPTRTDRGESLRNPSRIQPPAIDVRCPRRAVPERRNRLGGSRRIDEAGGRRLVDSPNDRFRGRII